MCGKDIYSPEILINYRTVFLIIASMLNADDIVRQMHSMGITNEYYIP